ncbi:MAG: rhamnogalacturonan acetylesterase [Bacteroidales bacterium]|nr:rhamnogalacturonan acetylesterase [Bacteroidales bacterium]
MRNRLLKYLGVLLFVLFSFSLDNSNLKISVFTIGDSTMANKEQPEINSERGWCQMLQQFFNDSVEIKNHAVNGRSTKSFIDEGRWDVILDSLNPGDYVFIQFGHNDQKISDPKRYTNPYTAYRRNLEKFVNDTRLKGATPVLFSSIVRRKYNENGVLEDTHGAYPYITRQVAKELNVPFIDLQLKTEDLVNSLGEEKSKELYLWIEPNENEYFPDGKIDNTHLSVKGGNEVARLAIEGIKELNLPLIKYIK